jgi:hypothetical protein
MKRRWVTVRDLMLSGKLSEAIRAIEVGGRYFVSDGNHRVSVAKSHEIEFIDAEIVAYDITISLPAQLNRKMIPDFRAKLDFQRRTRLFDYLDDEEIGCGHPRSWHILERHIFTDYRRQVAERAQPEMRDGDLMRH